MKSLTIATESQEQRALVSWLTYHPILKNFFCKNNNEGKRSDISGHNLKSLGLRPGVSDMFIYYPSGAYHGLWLEIKRNKKYSKSERSTLTWIAQEKFIETVKSVGYAGFFCYGWEEAKSIIENYLASHSLK